MGVVTLERSAFLMTWRKMCANDLCQHLWEFKYRVMVCYGPFQDDVKLLTGLSLKSKDTCERSTA